MVEQRYDAVLAVIRDGETVTDVAARFSVSRQTMHAWLARYEADGLEGLADRSHRARSCPHQMGVDVEVAVATMRAAHPSWGPRRLVVELARQGVEPVPSQSAVYRALVRLNLIDPARRPRRDRKWKRWERGLPMELWQMDVVGGFLLEGGPRAKALTGVDDHSRFCVSAHLMVRETSGQVCEGLAKALRAYGVPVQILTDNGKVFTGRFNHPPVEVLFDRVCRENGIEHLLTQPRSPTTTGKIERFHRSLRAEFRTDRVFKDLGHAQAELDEWVADYNQRRPHQAIAMATPAERFGQSSRDRGVVELEALRPERTGPDWVARRASAVGVVSVSWQQVCLGKAAAGRNIDVWVGEEVLQCWDGDRLLRTVKRDRPGPVRKKRASVPGARA